MTRVYISGPMTGLPAAGPALQDGANQVGASALQIALATGQETTGLCTVRECVQYMQDGGLKACEMYFEHAGQRWNVEVHIIDTAKLDMPVVDALAAGPT